MRSRRVLALLFILVWSASDVSVSGAFAQTSSPSFPETFETGTKTTYDAAAVQLGSGTWTLSDALLGDSDLDRKEGTKSVRLQNTGKLTMDFSLADGAGTITIQHAIYGTDASSSWELWAKADACGCDKWTKVGNTVITSTASLQTATFQVNINAPVRFEIRKTSGGASRLNIDEININGFNSPDNHYGDNDHLALGNPSKAITDVSAPNNYLMRKPEYALSYNRDRGIPNWVSWHLGGSDIGGAMRQDDFRADETLPTGWYRVHQDSYRNSGFDRGHNAPSADRTASIEQNSATFLMTNIIPQAPRNNQQTWNNFEQYTRTFINQGFEVYFIMGNYGVGGTGSNGTANTIDGGRVTIPNRVWKVAVILPAGDNDLSRISSTTRIIAIDTPNSEDINTNWGAYRVSIDDIEAATGLDLLSNLPVSVQATIEATVDNGAVN